MSALTVVANGVRVGTLAVEDGLWKFGYAAAQLIPPSCTWPSRTISTPTITVLRCRTPTEPSRPIAAWYLSRCSLPQKFDGTPVQRMPAVNAQGRTCLNDPVATWWRRSLADITGAPLIRGWLLGILQETRSIGLDTYSSKDGAMLPSARSLWLGSFRQIYWRGFCFSGSYGSKRNGDHSPRQMQIVLNGTISGLGIALLGTAFQLVYLPTRIFFVGLAGLYALAPFLFWEIDRAGAGWIVALVLSITATVALALAFERFNHAPLARKTASEGAQLITSLGIYIVLAQFIAMVWGNNAKTLRTGVDATIQLGDVVLTHSQLLMAGVASVLLVGFLVMLWSTDLGLRLRGLAENPSQFALYGHNVDAHRLVAFGFAGLFAASASLLTARDIGFDPHGGLHAVLLAVVAVIIGGRTSFVGPIIGGLLLGVIRAEVVWFASARWQEAITFAVLATFLLVRPQGICGGNTRVEATA